MLKGINKQIIEIKCSDNVYFDKILLFVRGDKSNVPFSLLQNHANDLCSAITNENGQRKSRKFLRAFLWSAFIATALIIVATVALLLV